MAIRVILEDQNGNVRRPAKVNETATVDRLIRASITTLQMPITDPAGRPITYYLAHNERRLQDSDTLTTAEVQEGDTLTLIPQMTAGAPFNQHPFRAYSEYPTLIIDPSSHEWEAFSEKSKEIRRCYQNAVSSKRD